MNYKYYRDLKHNYLIVNNPEGSGGESEYQLKMLESGRLSGLLPCDVRNVNGEQFLYYEIGSKQSLRDRYTSRGMNRAQQLQLFSDMKEMLEGLSEYLLGEEGVVFDADSIFVDLVSGSCSFMFCPFGQAEGSFANLTEQLLDMTNAEDEAAATAIYELCEYATGKGAMTMEGIERLLKIPDAPAKEVPQIEPAKAPIDFAYEPEDSEDEDEENEDEEELASSVKIRIHKNIGMKNADKKLSARIQLLFAGLFIVLVGVMVYVRKEYILTKQENYMSMGVMAVSLVCSALCFLSGFKGYQTKKDTSEASRDTLKEDEAKNYESPEEDSFDYNDYSYEENVPESSFRTPLKITSSFGDEECRADNKTVVLDMEGESSGILNLYSRNLDKTIRIGLDKLPLTIGKMEGCVDRVLKDMSVSRIHCRIVRDEETGRIALIDLNSTNGTFKNGLKLQPREKNYIDEGDEVRIGRICFDCR